MAVEPWAFAAERAIREAASQFNCSIETDTEDQTMSVSGPPGTCPLKVFLDDPSALSYAVGAGGWDDNHLGANVSIEEIAQCARELLLDVVSGGIEETIWRVGGEIESSDVKFARSGRRLLTFSGGGLRGERSRVDHSYHAYPPLQD